MPQEGLRPCPGSVQLRLLLSFIAGGKIRFPKVVPFLVIFEVTYQMFSEGRDPEKERLLAIGRG